ncbi:MAG: hemolysin family protein [Micrococcaceae bacterium]
MEWLLLSLGFLLILGTGFFVAVEFSLVALDQPAVQREADEGKKGAASLLSNLKSLSTQLSSCQLGITLTTLLTGYLMEPSLGQLLETPLHALGLSTAASKGVSVILAMAIATLLSMLIGELIPKNLAISLPMKVGKLLSPPMSVFTKIFKPLIMLLNNSANKVLGWMGLEAKEEVTGARSPEELVSMVKRSAKEGTLDEATANFLARTLGFSSHTAADVMTPRVKTVSVESDQTAADVIKLARTTGYSRFPVLGENSDEIRGVVHVKNAITVPHEKRNEVPVPAIMTEVLEVPETLKLDSLLTQLKESNFQMAVVLDEYGGTAGVATLEDCVEEIVGDVSDEHDRTARSIHQMRNGDWIIPAMSRPHEITEHLEKFDLDPDGQANFETLGGYIMEQLGRIPQVGDTVHTDRGTLTIITMDKKRVDLVRFTPHPYAVTTEEVSA